VPLFTRLPRRSSRKLVCSFANPYAFGPGQRAIARSDNQSRRDIACCRQTSSCAGKESNSACAARRGFASKYALSFFLVLSYWRCCLWTCRSRVSNRSCISAILARHPPEMHLSRAIALQQRPEVQPAHASIEPCVRVKTGGVGP
jgi:hypothetical protein